MANYPDNQIAADLLHFSLILYALPIERTRTLIPDPLSAEESLLKGNKVAWLSVVSSLDQGSQTVSRTAFEQTCYRLHVLHNGQPANLLFGISVGSLSAVATRNLWPMPWHLSAMEFQVSYDQTEGRYHDYRLQTQSQWANASWVIKDAGKSLLAEDLKFSSLPAFLSASTVNNYFIRRDGSMGLYKVRYHNLALTSGKLNSARSDMLGRLGLLSREEFKRPSLVAIQQRVSCQIFPPTILGESKSSIRRSETNLVRFAFAS